VEGVQNSFGVRLKIADIEIVGNLYQLLSSLRKVVGLKLKWATYNFETSYIACNSYSHIVHLPFKGVR
jgi:hypothetical protein